MNIFDIQRLSEKLLSYEWCYKQTINLTTVITDDTQLIHVLAKLLTEQKREIINLEYQLNEYEEDEK
jgi:ADP-ribosylglycohydrolase